VNNLNTITLAQIAFEKKLKNLLKGPDHSSDNGENGHSVSLPNYRGKGDALPNQSFLATTRENWPPLVTAELS